MARPETISIEKKEFAPLVLNQLCMKIKRTNDGYSRALLSITRKEWIKVGQEAGWPIPEEGPSNEPLQIEVKKYSDRTWAVYVNGELLCVTVYKKGAFAVESMLGELWQRIQDGGKVRMVG